MSTVKPPPRGSESSLNQPDLGAAQPGRAGGRGGNDDGPTNRSNAERVGPRRRLPPPGRGVHRCMVLAAGPEDTTAVDLRTRAFVRMRLEGVAAQPFRQAAAFGAVTVPGAGTEADVGRTTDLTALPQRDASSDEEASPKPGASPRPGSDPQWHDMGLVPFDVVDATWADDPQRDDLAQPEAVTLSGTPALVGRLGGRRARRLLKELVAPPAQHLLGFPGSAAPYWEFHGMRPSVALVVPSLGPLLFRRQPDNSVWARFGWPRIDQWLPVEDSGATAALWASGRDRLSGRALTSALGFRPDFLLVTVTRPRQGHCYKTVKALLPRP